MAFELRTTASRDGTKIAYYQVGTGPGLIILHGAMQCSLSHSDLATSLADSFTCYLPDRRGRGHSGPSGKNYSIQKEVEDVEAIHSTTGAKLIFGVSSGAWITLRAALAAPSSHLEKIAVFEPPWWPESEREAQQAWIRRFETEVEHGQLSEAAVTVMLGAQMGPAICQSKYFPRIILVLLTRLMMRFDAPADDPIKHHKDLKPGQQAVPLRALIPTFRNDVSVAMDMLGEKSLQTLSAIQTKTLILGGTKSPAYLIRSVGELDKVLPDSQRIELEGLDHGGTFNKAQRGSPERFAKELRLFFLGKDGKHV